MCMPGEQQRTEISNHPQPESDSNQPTVYQIRVKNHLNSDWADWFEGLIVTLEENGHTLITGPVIDQAALYRLLKKIRDLGMLLISVNTLEPSGSTPFGKGRSDAVDNQR